MSGQAAQPPTFRSRPLTLIYNLPLGKVAKFWEALKEGKVITTKCKKCGKVFFPPQMDCPQCMSSDMEWVELSDEAVLEAFSIVVVRPASFEKYNPYILAIGRLVREDVKISTWLLDVDPMEAAKGKVRVGMKLKLVVREVEPGRPLYYFVPAE